MVAKLLIKEREDGLNERVIFTSTLRGSCAPSLSELYCSLTYGGNASALPLPTL